MTKLFCLPAIFVGATFALWLLISNAPEWADDSSALFGNGQPIRAHYGATGDHDDENVANFSFSGNNTDHHGQEDGGTPTIINSSAADDDQNQKRPIRIFEQKPIRIQQQISVPITLPTQFDNFTAMADQFRAYKGRHGAYITALFICAYLYKQTFAIPGSFLLNIVAGAVFGLWSGFLLCCVLTTVGSTLCYLFSEFFSREYVLYYFGEKITYLQRKVDDNSHRLLAFLLFARMFPISPSWLLNIVAPFLNIPLPIFAFSVFIGLAPYNFICVQAGFILADLHSWDDVFSTGTMLKLSSFALLPLCYAMFVKRQRQQTAPKAAIITIKQFAPSKLLPFHHISKLQSCERFLSPTHSPPTIEGPEFGAFGPSSCR